MRQWCINGLNGSMWILFCINYPSFEISVFEISAEISEAIFMYHFMFLACRSNILIKCTLIGLGTPIHFVL